MSHLLDADPAGLVARFSAGLIAALLIALVGLRARALTPSGAAAALFVGASVYAGAGPACAAAVIAFFATGSVLSHMRNGSSERQPDSGATRDARQVLANGAAAATCALASAALRSLHLANAADGLALAAVVSIAGVAGDTWASEIGSRVGGTPRSITTFAVVQRRTSGAVTWAGTAAAAAGGAVVGLAAAPFGFGGGVAAAVGIGAAAGLVGSTIDSLFGASVQGMWHCGACDGPSDLPAHVCGGTATYVRGIASVDNDAVNALTSASMAALAVVVALMR